VRADDVDPDGRSLPEQAGAVLGEVHDHGVPGLLDGGLRDRLLAGAVQSGQLDGGGVGVAGRDRDVAGTGADHDRRGAGVSKVCMTELLFWCAGWVRCRVRRRVR
jgi:hypothetical protein